MKRREFLGFAGGAAAWPAVAHAQQPGDLPVQGRTKYEMVVNLKNANALNLGISESFLLRADEVIE